MHANTHVRSHPRAQHTHTHTCFPTGPASPAGRSGRASDSGASEAWPAPRSSREFARSRPSLMDFRMCAGGLKRPVRSRIRPRAPKWYSLVYPHSPTCLVSVQLPMQGAGAQHKEKQKSMTDTHCALHHTDTCASTHAHAHARAHTHTYQTYRETPLSRPHRPPIQSLCHFWKQPARPKTSLVSSY
jgi:hypothetical protein